MPTAAAAQKQKRAEVVSLDSDEEPGRKARYAGDPDDIAEQLASIVRSKKTFTLIEYAEEGDNPQKAKLVKADVPKNVEVLKIVGRLSLGKKQIEGILNTTSTKAELKFKHKSEKQGWIDAHRKRWMNLVRGVQQTLRKDPLPKWITKTLPFLIDAGENSTGEAADDDAAKANGGPHKRGHGAVLLQGFGPLGNIVHPSLITLIEILAQITLPLPSLRHEHNVTLGMGWEST